MNTEDTKKSNEDVIQDESPSNDEVISDVRNQEDIERVQSGLKKIAKEKPETLEMMSMQFGAMGNPLHSKMNEEHVTQVIDLAAKHDERSYELTNTQQKNDYEENKSLRRYYFGGLLVFIILIVIVLFLFKDVPNVLVPILAGVGGLATGLLGGYGFGKRKE